MKSFPIQERRNRVMPLLKVLTNKMYDILNELYGTSVIQDPYNWILDCCKFHVLKIILMLIIQLPLSQMSSNEYCASSWYFIL